VSTHRTEVYKVEEIFEHPNADRLEIIKLDNYTVCVGKGEFKAGDLVVHIPPDSVVDLNNPLFSFLKKSHIKTSKLRGIVSDGIVVKAPKGSKIGDNVMDLLNITEYVPSEEKRISLGGAGESPPDLRIPVYDIENLKRHPHIISGHTMVQYSEKIHGTSFRTVCHKGKTYVGSRKTWFKLEECNNVYIRAYKKYPQLKAFCEENENYVLYGEVYGSVQKLKYGHKQGEISLALFDIFYNIGYMNKSNQMELAHGYNLPWVPIIAVDLFNYDRAIGFSQGKSLVPGANHIREGCVITPMKEKYHSHLGRIQLKCVSDEYLLGKH